VHARTSASSTHHGPDRIGHVCTATDGAGADTRLITMTMSGPSPRHYLNGPFLLFHFSVLRSVILAPQSAIARQHGPSFYPAVNSIPMMDMRPTCDVQLVRSESEQVHHRPCSGSNSNARNLRSFATESCPPSSFGYSTRAATWVGWSVLALWVRMRGRATSAVSASTCTSATSLQAQRKRQYGFFLGP